MHFPMNPVKISASLPSQRGAGQELVPAAGAVHVQQVMPAHLRILRGCREYEVAQALHIAAHHDPQQLRVPVRVLDEAGQAELRGTPFREHEGVGVRGVLELDLPRQVGEELVLDALLLQKRQRAVGHVAGLHHGAGDVDHLVFLFVFVRV